MSLPPAVFTLSWAPTEGLTFAFCGMEDCGASAGTKDGRAAAASIASDLSCVNKSASEGGLAM
eukprot:CAMPEP_0185905434 /NCGR_PEP_ID=MMETSP0196C-20130402/4639_1 /TAXON_ID=2932 /ORGANISM="Alexandrium fundyense, Strain CCMP1719" /LENGTH=62 /DNA_ID=CAMNT_0028624953 /DNA_START=23 /DNA_END=208 /DNA_ORIENTATION=-